MRILYSHRIQSRDGMSVHVEEMVTAFLQTGHEVLVVGPGFYEAARFGGESSLVRLGRRLLPGPLVELAELAYNIPAYLQLRRAARRFDPDLIYERYNLYYLAGAWLAWRLGKPYYLEVNSPLAEERSRFAGLRLTGLARRLENRVWRAASRVLAVTGVLKDTLVAAGVPAEKISIVPNGAVPDRFPPAKQDTAALPKSDPVMLGFIGFVRSWHGLDEVIRSVAAHRGDPPIALTVIGDGPARPGLEELAALLGVAERVRFIGLVEHALVPALVARFDVALQPKVVAYASPLKVFDYMAAGCAIVAPDQPNIREILEHERTALLFDPDEDGALWREVERLAADADVRTRLGAAARAEMERRDLTWRGNAARIAAWAQADIVLQSGGRGGRNRRRPGFD
jgi:glycosyltransferase involved in cell wall biosynthesis